MRILDLFSGTHSLANAARPLGHEVVTLDNALPADIQCDFLEWDYATYPPGHFDLIGASPPCAVWSNARESSAVRRGSAGAAGQAAADVR